MNFTFNLVPDEQSVPSTILQHEERNQNSNDIEKNTKKGSQKRKQKIMNPYKWKSVQNNKYVNFLKSRMHLMTLSVAERKRIKINVIMSNYIKSRNPEQCRSHHQKMMTKYGSLESIIALYPKDFKELKRPNFISGSQQTPSPKKEEEMKNLVEDLEEPINEPFWHQYLDLYSCQQSEQFIQIQEVCQF